MTHYRQILINLAMEDDFDEKQLEGLRDAVQEFMQRQTQEKPSVKELEVKIN